MGITDAEKKQLDEQGCIVIPDVLSDEEIEVYRADILRLAEAETAERVGAPTHRWIWTARPLVGKQR